MDNQFSFFAALEIDGKAKRRKVDKLAPDAGWICNSGSTTTEVLDSTLIRIMTKYTRCGFLGDTCKPYNQFAYGWEGLQFDIAIMRMSVNYLMHEGLSYDAAVGVIRDHLYQSVYGLDRSRDGRPAGKKGEKVGDGRKARGTKKQFKVGKNKREWFQIALRGTTATLIDLLSDYRQYKTGRGYSWGRQKVLTFMSMINLHKDYKTPRMESFFFQDNDIL